MRSLRTFYDELRNLYARDYVHYEGVRLPPRHMRPGGPHFRDDEQFLSSAIREARRLIKSCGLAKGSRLLDIGCGPGRLAIGVLKTLGGLEQYHGIDVKQEVIDWCRRHIGATNERFRFTHIDVNNFRYNPQGEELDGGFRLPSGDESIDVINLYSVFSHMTSKHLAVYLKELRRVLGSGGRIFLTAFVEENVRQEEENPPGYRREWSGALHCVRYEKAYFESMLDAARMRVLDFAYGGETDGQSAYTLGKAE